MRASASYLMALPRILFLLSLVLVPGSISVVPAGSAHAGPARSVHADPGVLSIDHVRSIPCRDPVTGFAFSPLGVSFGLLGELYVVDSDNSRIFILPESLETLDVFAECSGEFPDCQLIDLEMNEAGGLYVSERTYGVILALDRWGEPASHCEVGEGRNRRGSLCCRGKDSICRACRQENVSCGCPIRSDGDSHFVTL